MRRMRLAKVRWFPALKPTPKPDSHHKRCQCPACIAHRTPGITLNEKDPQRSLWEFEKRLRQAAGAAPMEGKPPEPPARPARQPAKPKRPPTDALAAATAAHLARLDRIAATLAPPPPGGFRAQLERELAEEREKKNGQAK